MPETEPFDLYLFTRKLATELGHDWHADLPTDDHSHRRTHLRRVDDPQCAIVLVLGAWGTPTGKLHCAGILQYHPGSGNGLRYQESVVSINVSLTKTPAQVAKDLQRRLLPTYRDQYARNQVYMTEQIEYERTLDATAEAIRAMVRAYSVAHRSKGGSLYVRGDVATATTVKLTIDHVPLDLAQQIINLLPLT